MCFTFEKKHKTPYTQPRQTTHAALRFRASSSCLLGAKDRTLSQSGKAARTAVVLVCGNS